MKQFVLAFFTWLTVTSGASAEDIDSQAAAVIAQEHAWARALLADELDIVGALMHPEFRLIRAYSDAPPISKESYLGMTGMSANSVEVTSADVEVINNVAVAQMTWSLDWSQEGVGKLPPHFMLTDVWLKSEDGAWRIISRVSQLAEEPPETEN